MSFVLGEPFVQTFMDTSGNPLSSGTVEFYITGTSTPAAIYSDVSGTSAGTSVDLGTRGQPLSSGGTPIALFFDDSVTYKLIVKDSSGTAIPPTIDPYVPTISGSQSTVIYDTVADMKAASIVAGRTVLTRGYTTTGDGGNGTYLIAGSASVDGYGDHTLANGNIALLQDERPTVKQYGAVGDGVTDDRDSLNAMPDGTLLTGTHKISSALTLNNVVFGEGASLVPDSSVTVTVTGSVTSGDQEIFDGSASGVFDLEGVSTSARISWFSGQYLNDKWDNLRTWFCGTGAGRNWSCVIHPPTPAQGDAYGVVGGENKWIIDAPINLDFDCSQGHLFVEAPITNAAGTSNFNGFVVGNDAGGEKIVNLRVTGDLRVQSRDETDFLNRAIWISSGSRLIFDGLVGRGTSGVVIGSSTQAQNMGPVNIKYIFATGHLQHGVEISAGGVYSVQEVKVDNITVSSPNSNRTSLAHGVKIASAVRELEIGSILVSFQGAGADEPKGGVLIQGNNQSTQFGGNVREVSIGKILMDVCNGPILTVGQSTSGEVKEVNIGMIYSSGVGSDGASDEEHIVIDYADQFRIDQMNLINSRSDISIGANCGRVEINGLDSNSPSITNSGPKTFINGLGYDLSAAIGGTPANANWQVGDIITVQADNDNGTPTAWIKVKQTGAGDEIIQIA